MADRTRKNAPKKGSSPSAASQSKPPKRAAEKPSREDDDARGTRAAAGSGKTNTRSRSGAAARDDLGPLGPRTPDFERRARTDVASNGAGSREAGTKAHTGKYVYCIIQSAERCSFGHIGIGAEPTQVYTIGYEDISAVVSDTPLEVYDPTRENVLSHEHVNETVMHDHTVIPMSFGTVFKTADDIVELLRSAYSAFRDVLQKMQNKLEFGLKVLWDPEEIIQAVEKEDESLRRLREEILKQRGSTYFARMQYERLVDSLLQERSETFVAEIFDSLRPFSVATRVNKPIGERMIMNAAFLVSRDKEPEFDAEVKRIGARHPHLTFKYTGPWPPYNFVNIRLKLERAQESE